MVSVHRIFDGRRLLALLSLLIVAGFFATTLGSYFVSKNVIREAIIGQELPLASSNIYVALQKDLVQPVLISSTMAHDTFLRDWVLQGERNVSEMNRYLQEVKTRYGAFSTFFVSERSANYYTGSGVLKKVSPDEPRDAWYYRVRDLKADHEINVDPDMANQDAMTIFINYRVFDFAGKYLGATGIGVTTDAMHQRIKDYQQRYQRTIYFVDHQGKTVLFGQNGRELPPDLHDRAGLRDLVDRILLEKNGGYQYQANGVNYLLNVHYIPELNWYLFVEKDESQALAEVRKTLYINLGVCLLITVLVVMLMNLSLSRYQRRIEEMASTDKLTGLLNRQAYDILMDKLMAEHARQPRPISVLLLDLDHFKSVNDQYGHAMGDRVLRSVASQLRQVLRKSDIAVRWGGEEFLVVLNSCALDEARQIAEKIRQRIAQECLEVEGKRLGLSVSIGVSQFSGTELPDQTISRADAGLYQAKQGGRNRVDVAAEPAPLV
ncbi:sensor domain-containing diguanylate cyclase [Rhodoferax ferrireducens]|uniref:sensor domain-containing diguanylate cyclase n=1 Tax=Rhodoferax ferrireducens TaxID=192843 RepID=UPI000E0DA464|nr:sensor domain-containing diguanylate cyclase [Rhodoferax ferrireducens]